MAPVPSHRPPQPCFGHIYAVKGPRAELDETLGLLRTEAERQNVPFHGRVMSAGNEAFVFTKEHAAIGQKLETYDEDLPRFKTEWKAFQARQVEQRTAKIEAARRKMLTQITANPSKRGHDIDMTALETGVAGYAAALEAEIDKIDKAQESETNAFLKKNNPTEALGKALGTKQHEELRRPIYAMNLTAAQVKKYLAKGQFDVATGLRRFHPMVQKWRNFWLLENQFP